MDEFNEQFTRDYLNLKIEYSRLQELLKDVVWYNFETVVQHWNEPWPQSFEDSHLELHAHRYTIENVRGGRQCEKAEYPFYYNGILSAAPPLPPNIVLNELQSTWVDILRAERNCAAPYEFAPGGREYEKLLRESEGVQLFRALSSKQNSTNDSQQSKSWPGPLLGDPMEWQTDEDTPPTADKLLGRICGDRHMVCA